MKSIWEMKVDVVLISVIESRERNVSESKEDDLWLDIAIMKINDVLTRLAHGGG